jgi:hypothetical protein
VQDRFQELLIHYKAALYILCAQVKYLETIYTLFLYIHGEAVTDEKASACLKLYQDNNYEPRVLPVALEIESNNHCMQHGPKVAKSRLYAWLKEHTCGCALFDQVLNRTK